MRRPRSKLEVSTFPFLAVLLCVMGSLLLFLFIMDRRAKLAAQQRAAEDRQAREALSFARKVETQAEKDKRQAEWESAREKLRQTLLQQEQLVVAESQALQKKLDAANKNLALVQSRYQDAQTQLADKSSNITTIQVHLDQQRDAMEATNKKAAASKQELVQATVELAELVTAFEQLRARKGQEPEVYSLVPYRGKRGDVRSPIYVECVKEGVLFHPEKKLLGGLDFTVAGVIGEIERRAGPLVVEKSAKKKDHEPAVEKKGPYVLFLVRPAGIEQYYKTQMALRGYELDFGYELVLEHWALDFSGEGSGPSRPLPAPIPPRVEPSVPKVIPPPIAIVSGSPPEASPAKEIVITPVVVPPSLPNPGVPGVPGGGNGVPSIPPVPIPSPTGTGPGLVNPEGNVGVPPIAPPSLPGGTADVTPSPGNSGIPGKIPAPTLSTPTAMAPSAPNQKSSFVPMGKTAPTTPAIPVTRAAPAAAGGQGSEIVASTGSRPNRPSGEGLSPISAPIPGNSVVPPPPNPAPEPAPPVTLPPTGLPVPGRNVAPRSTGSPFLGTANPNASKGPMAPPFAAKGPANPAASSSLSKVLGNRDFVIKVDCYADHVNVFPGGKQFRWNAQTLQVTNHAFVQHVVKLIEARMATARPGEPPYRPMICFQVSAQGLRTYYHVYPLLEHLRVPMTRENVEE